MVFPLTGFTAGGPMANIDKDLGTPDQAQPFFDTEFHYRNGADHFFQKYREGRSDRTEGDVVGFWPSAKCVPANIYLLYTGIK
jgi:hypothetical protein